MGAPFDVSVFRWVLSQMSDPDRQALLSIIEALCGVNKTYSYLEIGSYLGGSLQPHVLDARCAHIYSIDPRLFQLPDERFPSGYQYEGNTTEHMLSLLSAIPGADIAKIQSFETSISDLDANSIPANIDFAFIDGEHTNAAVERDFEAVRRYLAQASIVAFHDCFFTPIAILRIARRLRRSGEAHRALYLPNSDVVAIVFGSEPLAGALERSGWKRELPMTYSLGVRLFLKRRLPKLASVFIRFREALLRKKAGV